MSQVKHKARGYPVPHADWHEVGAPMDHAEERAGPEDVGQQALMRGLDTAFPFFVWGCPGLRSGVDQMIGHTGSLGNSPAVVPPPPMGEDVTAAAATGIRPRAPPPRQPT